MDFVMVKITLNGRPIDPAKKLVGGLTRTTIPVWSRLHLYDGRDPEWLANWEKYIPQAGCACKAGYDEILKTFSWDFTSPETFFASGVELHNRVNDKIGYGTVSLDEALTLWRHRRPQTGRTRCVVTVATGSAFRDLLSVTGPMLQSYADKCEADLIVLNNITEVWWGFEKFRTRHFIGQYDEVLFLDADCLVHPDCESLFGRSKPVAIHNDRPFIGRADWLKLERKMIADLFAIEIEDSPTSLNSGVVYTRSDAASVWTDPPRNLPISQTSEQTWVEQSVLKLDYELLESRYNWQYYFPTFWDGLKDAKIAHLASSKDKLRHARQVLTVWGM